MIKNKIEYKLKVKYNKQQEKRIKYFKYLKYLKKKIKIHDSDAERYLEAHGVHCVLDLSEFCHNKCLDIHLEVKFM